ncbi:MAG: peptide MFS transporter [Pseudomonadota bacterium]
MTDMTAGTPAATPTFLGHPRGLVICFLTEMWERFSFYGMRVLLIFYLTQHFLFTQQQSSLIYGTYISLVYVMPVIGGWLADHYLGSRKAVTLGAILLVFGHAGMAFEGAGAREFLTINGAEYEVITSGRGETAQTALRIPGQDIPLMATPEGLAVMPKTESAAALGLPDVLKAGDFERRIERDGVIMTVFYLSLALIISGVGFLKANISTIVGALYEPGDARRDGGFTIFYMGINIGAFLAQVICGYIGIVWGWAYGFGLAGIGMLLGLVIFLWGQPWLAGRADPPDPEKLKQRGLGFLNVEWTIYASALIMIAAAFLLVQAPRITGGIQLIAQFAVFGALIFFSFRNCTATERDRMLVAIFLTLCQVPFWALFEQTGSSLSLFIRDAVDRNVLGFTVPATLFQSLNAMFIFTLAPLFAITWVWLSKRGKEPSTPVKFGLALVQVGLGFLVLVAGISAGADGAKIAIAWIVLLFLLHTTGELCLSPVGLSMITKLSVARVVGATMGGWMLAQALAGYLSGIIAANTGAETIGGQITDLGAAKAGYADVYSQIGWLAIGCGAVLLMLSPVLKKRMHGIH